MTVIFTFGYFRLACLNRVNACSAASEAATAKLIAFCPSDLSMSFDHFVGIDHIL